MRIIRVSDPEFDFFWQQGEKKILGATVFYTRAFRQFDKLLFSESMIFDDSFAVVSEAKEVVALVPLYAFKSENGLLQYSYGEHYLRGPIIVGVVGKKYFDKTADFVFQSIDEIAAQKCISRCLMMMEPVELLERRHYYNYYLEYGYEDVSAVDCLIECGKEEELLWSDVRKSYRPLINKAIRNYKSVIIGQNNFDFDLCEEYRKLHHSAAGRITRPANTFHRMYEMIKSGNAFLVLIQDADLKTVGAYYFLVHGPYGYYGSAATDPSLYPQSGVGHLGLWNGILFAKKQGCQFMDLGQLLIRPGGVTEKEKNIFLFKTGFGGQKVVVFRAVKNFTVYHKNENTKKDKDGFL